MMVLVSVSCALPMARAATWGRLANPGFEGDRMKATYFFAGQAEDGKPHRADDGTLECSIGPNLGGYAFNPLPRDTHLNWTPSNRAAVLNQMLNAGINVISMSFWGEDFSEEGCMDGWVKGIAPMQTSSHAQNELFAAAVNKSLLIIPFIEGRANWQFKAEFPYAADGKVSPRLVSQIVNLVNRYLKNTDHPEWKDVWAKVYDRNGQPRYGIGILHACSDRLSERDDAAFAAGFKAVADEVAVQTNGIQVGFFLDAITSDASPRIASFEPSAEFTGLPLSKIDSILGIQCFIPQFATGKKGDDVVLAWRRNFIAGWFSTGIPVVVDASPGYFSPLFGDPAPIYGYDDVWMQGSAALVDDYGQAGMVYNAWNGYTEGLVGTPTAERGSYFYDWLTSLNALHVDHNAPGPGNGSVSAPFPTVTAANAAARNGDHILIRSGNYPGPITFSKRLTLQAENGPVTLGP